MGSLEHHRILVTGGAGFVGSHLTSALTSQDAEVGVVDNQFAGTEDYVPQSATFWDIDLRADELGDVVKTFSPTVIIHLAAIHHVPYCNQHPREAFDVNVVGTRNLVSAATDCEALNTLIFASTAAVYPPRSGPNSEDSETGPIDPYGKTKLVGEDLVENYHHKTGSPAVSARLFNIYGRNETNPHLIPEIISQLKEDPNEVELGNLSPKRDFIHVSDVVDALLAMLNGFEGEYRTYNVGTGVEYSVREVVETCSEALGTEITISQDEDKIRESDRPHLQADPARLQSELDWEPTIEFVDGLRQLMRHHGLL